MTHYKVQTSLALEGYLRLNFLNIGVTLCNSSNKLVFERMAIEHVHTL